MNIHKRIAWFFDHHVTRMSFIALYCLGMFWAFFLRSVQSDYTYGRTEAVEVVSFRPIQSRWGGHRVLLTFELGDGRRDTMSLPEFDTFETGQTIRLDVMIRDGKKNLYRLAADPDSP